MTEPESTSVLTNMWVIVLLLAANAFFVAAEFALVKARGVRVQALAEGGGRAAALTVRIQGNLEAYLAACQLGITMASLGLGWVGEPTVAAMLRPMFEGAGFSEATLHTVSFLVGFLIFSSLHIVVGEQVPKTLAIRKPEPVSVLSAYPLHAFFLLFYPLNWLLNAASGAILRVMGVAEAPHIEVLTSDELRGLIDVSTEHGELHEGKATMLHNLFQFDQRPVERIMVPRRDVARLDLTTPIEENLEIIRESNHSRLPLIDGEWDALVGVVLTRDVLLALIANPGVEPDLRTTARPALVVPESQPISQLFESMRTERAHMSVVVDEYGEVVGLVTLEDLIEEIVGDISDEFDEVDEETGIWAVGDGWRANGLVHLTDVERVSGFKAAEPCDANTVSGFFMLRLARLPRSGDELLESGYRLRVLGVEQRHVKLCEIAHIDAEARPSPDEDA